MSTDTNMHEILESSLAKAMERLDPVDPDDDARPPIQRLNDLADAAVSGFPLLVIAFEDAYTRWGDHHDAYHETIVVDDAVELVAVLATLDATRDLDSLEFYRLAAYSRDIGDNHCAHDGEPWNVMSDEERKIMKSRVGIAAIDQSKLAADAREVAHAKTEDERKARDLESKRAELARLQSIVDAADGFQ